MEPGRAIAINGVDLWELRGSGDLSSVDGNLTGTRLFLCSWEDRPAAFEALLGNAEWIEGSLVITPADSFPGFTFLKAIDVDSGGTGALDKDTDDSALYEYARLTVTYRLPESPTEEDEGGGDSFDVTETMSWRSEYLTVPEGTVVWDVGSAAAGEPLLDKQTVPIGLIERRFMRKNLETIPMATIAALQNHVNNAAFKGAAIGHLLFTGAESQKKVGATGAVTYDVTYVFLQRSVDWNSAWSVADNDWMPFVSDPLNLTQIFPQGDFTLLQTGTD